MFRCPLHCKQNPIYVFPERKLCSLVSNFHILVSVRNLYIPMISSPIWQVERDSKEAIIFRVKKHTNSKLTVILYNYI
jgi:hypothetical protein